MNPVELMQSAWRLVTGRPNDCCPVPGLVKSFLSSPRLPKWSGSHQVTFSVTTFRSIPGNKAGVSSHRNGELKNEWSYTPLPMYFHGVHQSTLSLTSQRLKHWKMKWIFATENDCSWIPLWVYIDTIGIYLIKRNQKMYQQSRSDRFFPAGTIVWTWRRHICQYRSVLSVCTHGITE